MTDFIRSPDFTKPAPDFTRQLENLTSRVASARIIAREIVEGQQAKQVLQCMADKTLIKGLAEAMASAKKSLAAARAAPAALQESAAALAVTCSDLKTQVDEMHDDIKFEATQLGNGSPNSEDQS
jgi:hypothetical protein